MQNNDAVATVLADGTFIADGNTSVIVPRFDSQTLTLGSSRLQVYLDERELAEEKNMVGGSRRPSFQSEFRPQIRGGDDDVAAGVPGPAWVKPQRSEMGYGCRAEYVPPKKLEDPNAQAEVVRKKRLMTPSYPRTTIPIGYQGSVPGGRETYGGTYGLMMGSCTPTRINNLLEKNASEVRSRWSTTSGNNENDRLSTPQIPSQISPTRVASAPPRRPSVVSYAERHRRDARRPSTAYGFRTKTGHVTKGSANMLYAMTPPTNGSMGWNTKNRASSPSRGQPSINEAYIAKREGARRTWDALELQELLRDKINQKTSGANNKVLSAIRLFDREGGVITAASFCTTVPRLVQVDLNTEVCCPCIALH